jgi:hypothetical protein
MGLRPLMAYRREQKAVAATTYAASTRTNEGVALTAAVLTTGSNLYILRVHQG